MSEPASIRLTLDLPDRPPATLRVAPEDCETRLDALLARAGYALNTRCAGRGLCQGCAVELRAGTLRHKGNLQHATQTLPACECQLHATAGEAVVVHVPRRSLLAHSPRIEDAFVLKVSAGQNPLFEQVEVKTHAFAVDLGTTTVAVLLVDLRDGRIVDRASALNAQVRFGDNVLTRIEYAGKSPAALGQLQRSLGEETLVPLLRQLMRRASLPAGSLAGMAVAANTVMLHLLAGIDPTPLGIAPFQPVFLEHRIHFSDTLGLVLEDGADPFPVHLLPGLGPYVGADLNAGLAALGLPYRQRPSLLVDIGTNGEIVLQTPQERLACATAAGPAFEGAGLDCGTRAVEGAISEIAASPEGGAFVLKTIGAKPAKQAAGVCGSAYLDFLAVARQGRLLNQYGRFEPNAWDHLQPAQRTQTQWGRALRLNPEATLPLHISEADIASLLQAKAAIAAGIDLLLQSASLKPEDIETLYLAGGFGRNLNVSCALACGLLPGFREGQIEVVGNTSLGGTYLCLLDVALVDELERFRHNTTLLELNQLPDFEDTYLEHLALP
ncbi:MAG: ASKHA domain-containing protein [Opitutales bacterium]